MFSQHFYRSWCPMLPGKGEATTTWCGKACASSIFCGGSPYWALQLCDIIPRLRFDMRGKTLPESWEKQILLDLFLYRCARLQKRGQPCGLYLLLGNGTNFCALRSREKLSLAFLFGFHPISYSTFLTVAPPRPSKITDVFELYLSIVTCTNGPLVLLFAEIALPFGW